MVKRNRSTFFLIASLSIFFVAGGTLFSAYYKPDRAVQSIDRGKVTTVSFRAGEVSEQGSTDSNDRTRPLPRIDPSSLPLASPVLQDAEGMSSYQVIAIFDGRNDEKSSAVIVTNGIEIGQYKVGEVLPGQHILSAIFPNRVVVRNGGIFLTVHISPRADRKSFGSEQFPSSLVGTSEPSPFKIIRPEYFSAENIKKNRRKILKINDLTPVSDISPLGYIIGERFYPKLLNQIGAGPGDTIVSVNGFNVGNEAADLKAAESFRQSGSAFLIILTKEGRYLMLEYP